MGKNIFLLAFIIYKQMKTFFVQALICGLIMTSILSVELDQGFRSLQKIAKSKSVNKRYRGRPSGEWGGQCKCPNGEVLTAGDLNWCKQLACNGGKMLSCNKRKGPWSFMVVDCKLRNKRYRGRPAGKWGGSCKCPNGEVLTAGDIDGTSCAKLSCKGGKMLNCNKREGPWSWYAVECKKVTKKVAAKKVVAKKPVAKKPVAKKPVAKKPVAKKPAAKKPVVKKTTKKVKVVKKKTASKKPK